MSDKQTFRISEVGRMFKRSRHTIRNWIENDDLKEFFSPEARRDNDEAEARFTIEDVEVCNSIFVMLRQKATWRTIAENLRSGWRDTDLPEEAAFIRPAPETPSHVETVARLALASEQYSNAMKLVGQLEDEIKDLRQKLDTERTTSIESIRSLEHQIAELERDKAVLETQSKSAIEKALLVQELEFMRSGRLRPPSSE